MLIKEANDILGGGLCSNSKMPGATFPLSTSYCNVGGKLQEKCGSVCNQCYAKRLENFRPSVRKGHESRTLAVLEATKSKEGMNLWVEAMVKVVLSKTKTEKYMRLHDSGDLLNMNHLHMIVMVARALPDINFWLPTKEKKLVNVFLRNRIPPTNLMIRVSSAMIDAPPMRGYAFTSTVHKDKNPQGHICPAPEQDGECKDCRACWSHDVLNVSYHKH